MNVYDDKPKRKRGRPPLPPEEKKGTNGNPLLQARVPQEVNDWVRAQPGGLHELIITAYLKRKPQ